ncbi:MAG: 23S rRNA (pseudouridine(1915)-N(3))-methyltransferase RlmH [Candidatus Thalassarchaeaceae archaeon]|nr:23S rRNA (pseudouridine(1915)-N(3))-methyltransferase RlmH [Candidatus Thalassarchaeaceae archaeon]
MVAWLLRHFMGRIFVHTHGKTREKGYSHLIQKYSERLGGRGVSLVAHSDKLDHDEYLEKIKGMVGGSTLILLDENGEAGTTEWMVDNWKRWKLSSKSIHLAVGPVDGYCEDISSKFPLISLGPLTMTYEMAAVVLLEQLYRASEIERGSPYHRS